MKKCLVLLLLIISMGILSVGCKKKNSNSTESAYHDAQQEHQSESVIYPTTYPANHSVTWVFFGYPGIPENNQRKINQILFEKGMDCQIKFINIGVKTGLEYERALDEYEKTEPADIITSGVWGMGESEQFNFLETHVIPLNVYLGTETGKKLKEFYTENEWKQVTQNGNIYVIPKAGYVAEDVGVDSGVYASVNDKYRAYFEKYDGTYVSLKAIYEEIGDKNLHIVVSGFSDMIIYGMLGYSTIFHLPVQNETGRIVNISKSSDFAGLLTELYSDLKSGVLINQSISPGKADEVLAYIHLCKGVPIEGFREVLVAPSLYDTSFGNRYGIAIDSKKKDLAFQVLSLCYSNPEILSQIYPGLDAEVIARRMELLSSGQRSNFAGIHIELSDSQAEGIMKYSNEFIRLMSSIYIYNSSGELELNPDFKPNAALEEFVARISTDTAVFDDIDRAIQNWIKSK